MLEAELSNKLLGLSAAEVKRIRNLFVAAGLPVQLSLGKNKDKFFAAMAVDKKSSGGVVKFVLAETIGKVKFGQKVPREELELLLVS